MGPLTGRPLRIFVCHASDCLTDHALHGEGLLAHSWLRALAERGHEIVAYSPLASVNHPFSHLRVLSSARHFDWRSFQHIMWNRESQKLYRTIAATSPFEIVWRMYPYQEQFPYFDSMGAKLVIGPLYSSYTPISLLAKPPLKVKLSGLAQRLGWRGWEHNFARANVILTDTRRLQGELLNQWPDRIIAQLPAAIDPPIPVGRREPFTDGLRLCFIGHFHPSKRLLHFCRVIEILKLRGLPVKGIIIGEGEDGPLAKEFCFSRQDPLPVEFLGKIANQRVFEAVARCDLLLSMRPETYGRSIVEAMAVGTPAVCVNQWGPADFLQNMSNGILLDNASVDSFAEVVQMLFRNPGTWKSLHENALATASQWTSTKIAHRLESTFYRALAIAQSRSMQAANPP